MEDAKLNAISSRPKLCASTTAAAIPSTLWVDGISGTGGLGSSVSNDGSGCVRGLPSCAASWIAVTGRQKLYRYFESQPAMYESASAMISSAKVRARCHKSCSTCAAATRAMRFQPMSENSYQNAAWWVSSSLRALPAFLPPTRRTSSRSRAYCSLLSAGAGALRNWAADFSANGFTRRQCGAAAKSNGGV